MPFTKMLRPVSLGLISLFGGLILVGLAIWIHYRIYGLLSPDKFRPLEDWLLRLKALSLILQITSAAEALVVSVLTRRRWLPYKQGRAVVWLLSLIGLSQVLFSIWAAYPAAVSESLVGGIFILLPLGVACWLVKGD